MTISILLCCNFCILSHSLPPDWCLPLQPPACQPPPPTHPRIKRRGKQRLFILWLPRLPTSPPPPRIKRRGKQRLFILWLPRGAAVALIVCLGLLLVWRSAALLTLAWALLLGLGLPLLHATLRAPNLKASLVSSKEEFRAVW